MRTQVLAFVAASILGVALTMLLPKLIRSLLYFPTHYDAGMAGGDGFVAWRSQNGNFLGYIRQAPRAAHTVLIFHGNGGEALHRGWYAAPLHNARVNIILAEYPGYGAYPGAPTESSIFAAADTAVLEARKLGVPLIVVGESLGSSVACFVASKHSIERLALISPFSSVTDVARAHYGWIAFGALIPDHFESTSFLPQYKGPLHIIHGTDDEVVPIALGRRLFATYAGTQGEFTEVRGFHHNDMSEAIMDQPQAHRFRAFIRGEAE